MEPPLVLGIFEWACELWKGVMLENTFDAYRRWPLRNQLGRGSAWGFFVTALPQVEPGRPVSVKVLALNPTTKTTPELVVDGERIGGNICDTPARLVSTAADAATATCAFRDSTCQNFRKTFFFPTIQPVTGRVSAGPPFSSRDSTDRDASAQASGKRLHKWTSPPYLARNWSCGIRLGKPRLRMFTVASSPL